MGSALNRRRFRLPVVSRLTWAWTAFVSAGALISIWSLTINDVKDSPRVALRLAGEIERFAPPTTVSVMPRLTNSASAAPALRDGSIGLEPPVTEVRDVFAAETGDWLNVPDSDEILIEEGDAITITVDGAPARHPGQRVAGVHAASLTQADIQIPDPYPAMLQKTPLGAIPKIAEDGRRASKTYARPLAPTAGKKVAVIVGGLGLNRALTERAIDELPAEVTLSFAPYAKDLDVWTARARAAGHEIMIELPMEGRFAGGESLGPAALLTSRTPSENLQRLDWLLARFGGYFAATNYQGARFSASEEAMAPILARLHELGVGYVDDTGAARRSIAGYRDAGVVNRMLAPGDDGADLGAVKRDLASLEAIAARDGAALGKAYAYDTTIEAIRDWTSELQSRDVALAPASAVIQARASAR